MKKLIATLILTMSVATAAEARKVAGVDIPDTASFEGSSLTLNGAGVRSKWMIDVYVGGLYLTKASADAAAIVGADEAQAIKLHMVSGMVTSEKMKKATMEGFENSTNGNIAPLQAQIDQFMSVFNEEIVENDVFDIVYVPGKGVEVYKNEELADTIGGGMDFKKAVFGIWLSDKPAQESLKKEMLGG